MIAEKALFEFFTERIAAAMQGTTLYNLELHDTVYRSIKTDRGLRIGTAVRTLAPANDDLRKELDARLPLAVFSRVLGVDKPEGRLAALESVIEIASAVCQELENFANLGDRVCDTFIEPEVPVDFDTINSDVFAVAEIWVIVNPTGKTYAGNN
jgi:hypothetical protein